MVSLASASDVLKIWSFDGKGLLLTSKYDPIEEIFCVAWNHTNQVVGGGGHGNKVFLIQANNGQILSSLQITETIKDNNTTRSVAFSGNSRFMAVAVNSTVQVWDLKRRQLKTLLSGHLEHVLSTCFLPTGEVVSGDAQGVLRIWDTKHFQSSHPLHVSTTDNLHSSISSTDRIRINCIGVSSASSPLLGVGYSSGLLGVWDPVTYQCTRKQYCHNGPINSLAYSPKNPRLVATAGADGRIALMDTGSKTSSSEASATIQLPVSRCANCVTFHEDAIHTAVGLDNGAIYIYDWRNIRKPVVNMESAHSPFPVRALSFQIPRGRSSTTNIVSSSNNNNNSITSSSVMKSSSTDIITPAASVTVNDDVLPTAKNNNARLSNEDSGSITNNNIMNMTKAYNNDNSGTLSAISTASSLDILPPPYKSISVPSTSSSLYDNNLPKPQSTAIGINSNNNINSTNMTTNSSSNQNLIISSPHDLKKGKHLINSDVVGDAYMPKPALNNKSSIGSNNNSMTTSSPSSSHTTMSGDMGSKKHFVDEDITRTTSGSSNSSSNSTSNRNSSNHGMSLLLEKSKSTTLQSSDSNNINGHNVSNVNNSNNTNATTVYAAVAPATSTQINYSDNTTLQMDDATRNFNNVLNPAKFQYHPTTNNNSEYHIGANNKAAVSTITSDSVRNSHKTINALSSSSHDFTTQQQYKINSQQERTSSSNNNNNQRGNSSNTSNSSSINKSSNTIYDDGTSVHEEGDQYHNNEPHQHQQQQSYYPSIRNAIRPVTAQDVEVSLDMLRYDIHREVQEIIREQVRQFAIAKDDTATLIKELMGQMAELLQANKELRAENEYLRRIY